MPVVQCPKPAQPASQSISRGGLDVVHLHLCTCNHLLAQGPCRHEPTRPTAACVPAVPCRSPCWRMQPASRWQGTSWWRCCASCRACSSGEGQAAGLPAGAAASRHAGDAAVLGAARWAAHCSHASGPGSDAGAVGVLLLRSIYVDAGHGWPWTVNSIP